MKHEFRDELRIKVEHEHDINIEIVDEIIGKVVDGAVTVIACATVASVVKRLLK